MSTWWQRWCDLLQQAAHADQSEKRERKILPDGRWVIVYLNNQRRLMQVVGDKLVDERGEVAIESIKDGTLVLRPGDGFTVDLYGGPDTGVPIKRREQLVICTDADGRSGRRMSGNGGYSSAAGSPSAGTGSSDDCILAAAVVVPIVLENLVGQQDSN